MTKRNRFYATFNHEDESALPIEELTQHIRQVMQNPQLELKLLKADLQSEASQEKVLTSSEQVWQRVNNNPLFKKVCDEFGGSIIDVRG